MGYRLSRHKMTRYSKNFGVRAPPATSMIVKPVIVNINLDAVFCMYAMHLLFSIPLLPPIFFFRNMPAQATAKLRCRFSTEVKNTWRTDRREKNATNLLKFKRNCATKLIKAGNSTNENENKWPWLVSVQNRPAQNRPFIRDYSKQTTLITDPFITDPFITDYVHNRLRS